MSITHLFEVCVLGTQQYLSGYTVIILPRSIAGCLPYWWEATTNLLAKAKLWKPEPPQEHVSRGVVTERVAVTSRTPPPICNHNAMIAAVGPAAQTCWHQACF